MFEMNIPLTRPLVFLEENLVLPKGLLPLLWETGAPSPARNDEGS